MVGPEWLTRHEAKVFYDTELFKRALKEADKTAQKYIFSLGDSIDGVEEPAMRLTELVRKRMKEIGELLVATPAKEDVNEGAEHMMVREAYLEVLALSTMLKAEIDRQEACKT